mmetsp:Transcript_44311/g.78311  ORF Transcript_44311/g.78311 Transcript_44311/m.78311 type:complete len:886 (+) Transcript_44311:1866-4523(+)
MLVEQLGGLQLVVQGLHRRLHALGLAVGGGALAVCLGGLRLALVHLTDGLVQRLHCCMQAAEEGRELGAQQVLGFVAVLHAVLLATGAFVLVLGLRQRVELAPLGLQRGNGVARGLAGLGIGCLFRQHGQQALAQGGQVLGRVLELPHALVQVAVHLVHKLLAAALVQAGDEGDVLDLRVAQLAVGTVHLGEDVAGVDEQHLVIGLALVEEPQRGRQRDGIEEVGRQREHAVNEVVLDQRAADVGLGVAGIAGRVGHHQRGTAAGLQRRGEEVDPEVVAVGHGLDGSVVLVALAVLPTRRLGLGLVAGDAVGVEAAVLLHGVQRHVVHVERRVGHHVVEGAEGVEGVFVVGVGLLDLAAQVVHGEVHLGELHRLQRLLGAANEHVEVSRLVGLVLQDEVGRLHEHAAGAAGGVEHLAAVGLDDFGHQLDDGARREELAAALALAEREVGQEILVDLAEHVAGGVHRDVGEQLEQVLGDVLVLGAAGEAVVLLLRQHAQQLGLGVLDAGHRRAYGLGDVFLLGQVEQVVVARLGLQVEAAFLDGDVLLAALSAGALELLVFLLDGRLVLAVLVVGKLQEDQAQHRGAVLAGFEVGVGAQLVGGGPEVGLQLLELFSVHVSGAVGECANSGPVGDVFGKLVAAVRVLALDAAGIDRIADQVGDGVALLFVQLEALTQRGVGECLAGEVLQHGVLVAGLDTLGRTHVGKLARRTEGDAEGVLVRRDLQWRQAEEFDGLNYLLETGAALLAYAKSAEGRGQPLVAGLRRGANQPIRPLAGQQGARVGDGDAVVEDVHHRASTGDAKVLVNQRIGDQLSQGDLGVDGCLGAQRLLDDFRVRQHAAQVADQPFKGHGISTLAGLLVDGVDLVGAAIAHDANALSLQRRKVI